MASGDSVVQVLQTFVPNANFPQLTVRAGGSTPGERIRLYAFDAATIEYMDYLCKLEGYDGGGLTFTLPWSAATATTGNCVWSIAVRRMNDDAEDIDVSHTYDYNNVTDAAPTASGEIVYPTLTFTNGADMDSWAEGELAIVRLRRFASDAADTMTGDAEFWGVPLGLET